MIRLQFSEHPDRGHWDQALVEDLFGDIDDNIVLIPAKDQAPYIDKINQALAKLKYCVVLIMSDEESEFPYEDLYHARMKTWVQYPKRSADRYLPAGYSPDTPKLVEKATRTLDWFFSGQITRDNRYSCAENLRTLGGGLLIETEGFTQGLNREDYLKILSRTKIAPCPGGVATPDTIRLYEALEAGCMPVIYYEDEEFFNKILGDFPFPVVRSWQQVSSLQYVDYTDWWNRYKMDLISNMKEDLKCLKES